MAAKQDSLTSPALNERRSARKSSRPLYIILGLYIAVSLGFYIVGVIAATQQWFHPSRYARRPLDVNEQTGLIDSVQQEAAKSGIKAGDRLEALNGVPFTGDYQFFMDVQRRRPGEALTVTVQHPNGAIQTVSIHLAPRDVMIRNAGDIGLFAVLILLPIVSLGVGYWVVAARPGDLNAWFVLIVLSNTEAFFGNLDWRWWPNPWFAILGGWWVAMATLGDPALVLLGIYFPERWRVDVRWPWAKWLMLVPLLAGFPSALLYVYVNSFVASWGPAITPAAFYFNHVVHVLSAIVNIVFWVAIFDKMRSATTADARRRLRVLAIGSAISLGPVEFIFVVFPLLGLDPHHNSLYELIVLFYVIFILTLAYVLGVQRAMDVRILVRMGTKYALARTTLTILRIAGIAALIWLIAIPLFSHRHSLYQTLFWSAVLVAFAFLFFKKKSPTDLVGQWIDRKFFREAYDAEITLANLAKTARTISDPAALIKTVSHQISDVLHVDQIAVLLRRNGIFEPAYAIGQPYFGRESLRALDQSNSSTPVFNNANDEQIPDPDTPELLLPLPGRTELLGAMALGPKRSEAPYTPSDLRLLESVGVQTGLGLELSETAVSLAQAAIERASAAREMEIAREVQERLFPQQFPAIPGITLAGTCRTVFGVGGDYYDAFDTGDGRLGLAIGDVSGKGISAALLMSSLRACLRTLTLDASGGLTTLMRKMNRLIYEASAVNRYATFFLGIYDPPTCRLEYVNAGHNPPALIRPLPDGTCQHLRLETGGPVVGLLPDVCYEEDSLLLHAGDLLLAYTDGISEAMTAADEEWGEEAMILAAQYATSETAEDIVKAIFEAADAFTKKAPQHDDMTVLVMKLSSLLP